MTAARQIVITGVSRGLGRAMVAGFVARGHVVHGCARSQPALAELAQLHPAPHTFSQVDVADDRAVAAWAKQLAAAGVVPDLLVNNAAVINTPNRPLWEVPAAEFSTIVDVNLKGVANVMRHFLPAMIDRRRGVIVNFSSGWGRSVAPEVAPYCATKWAIEGLTKALADELPPGMAAVPLNPGVIDTDLLRSCFGEDAGSYPDADRWAAAAVPFILELGPDDNGESLSAPG